jgi:GMP reductase
MGKTQFNVPVIPANMKAVINTNIARWMSASGYFYIMHRFGHSIIDFIRLANVEDWQTISISVGVQEHDEKIIEMISEIDTLHVDYITIDIAHGHSERMQTMIRFIKDKLPHVYLIAGNVASSDGVYDLSCWGADMVKVGIGQGSVCTTKDKTGFTVPMFTCIQTCTGVINGGKPVPIIADGGIRSNGDIAKALCAGADMIMSGSMFSQCTDSAAANVVVDDQIYKQYFGSASSHNKGHRKHIEGVMKAVPSNNMTYHEKLKEIQEDLQSAISYAGGASLQSLRDVEYVEV